MEWLFEGKILDEENIPKWAIGFIYMITQKSTGKRYIGRKLLTKASRKTINGKTKKTRIESDWKTYWSSSPEMKNIIKECGIDDFERVILTFVSSKGSLAYSEELALYLVGALESDDWVNSNIRSKIYRSWVKKEEAKKLREVLTLTRNDATMLNSSKLVSDDAKD